jgi:hypothetical protein
MAVRRQIHGFEWEMIHLPQADAVTRPVQQIIPQQFADISKISGSQDDAGGGCHNPQEAQESYRCCSHPLVLLKNGNPGTLETTSL